MQNDKQTSKTQEAARKRQAYEAPRLTRFGRLAEITLAAPNTGKDDGGSGKT